MKEENKENVTLSRQEYDDLQKRLAELEALKDRLMVSAADFDNAKKRLMKERDEFIKFSQENMIRSLLGVLDNFERALAHASTDDPKALKGIVAGIQMVFKQLQEILKSQGVERLKTIGEKFDPHQHEAVGHVYEDGPEDVIVAEHEAGYRLHDRLLRAAKVRVRSSSPQDEEKQEEIT